jgi:uncharacterized protein (DUF4415 family)
MQSKTDWARIDQMSDEEIDTSDNPPLDDNFFAIPVRNWFAKLQKHARSKCAVFYALTSCRLPQIFRKPIPVWYNAEWRMPEKKTAVTLSIDSEVLKWFESQGADFPQRVNAALKIYAQAHQE